MNFENSPENKTEKLSIPAEETGSREKPYEGNVGDDIHDIIMSAYYYVSKHGGDYESCFKFNNRLYAIDSNYDVSLKEGSSVEQDRDGDSEAALQVALSAKEVQGFAKKQAEGYKASLN